MKLTQENLKEIIKKELEALAEEDSRRSPGYGLPKPRPTREPPYKPYHVASEAPSPSESEIAPDDLVAYSGSAIEEALARITDCQDMIEQLLSTEGSGAFMAFSTRARMVHDALEDLLERHAIAAREYGRFKE